jgi:hypothetical protein
MIAESAEGPLHQRLLSSGLPRSAESADCGLSARWSVYAVGGALASRSAYHLSRAAIQSRISFRASAIVITVYGGLSFWSSSRNRSICSITTCPIKCGPGRASVACLGSAADAFRADPGKRDVLRRVLTLSRGFRARGRAKLAVWAERKRQRGKSRTGRFRLCPRWR